MKKIIQLLEKYVQWAALAVGAAFLGYMVWIYIIQNPAAKTMTVGGASQTVTPGTVDPIIRDTMVATLKTKIEAPGTITLEVPQLARVDLHPATTQPVVATAADSWPQDISKLIVQGENNPSIGKIAQLPTLPPLHYLAQEELRTVLQIPAANGAAPTKQDQDSVTTFWSLPLAQLAKAYDDAFAGKIGPDDQKVLFAHADLVRQQLMPNGTWGPEVVVDRQANMPPPVGQPAYPNPASPDFKSQATGYGAWLTGAGAQKAVVGADFPPVYYDAASRADLQWKPIDALNGPSAAPPAAPGNNPAGPGAPPAQPAQPFAPFGSSPTTPAQGPAGQPPAGTGTPAGHGAVAGTSSAASGVTGVVQQVVNAQQPAAQGAQPLGGAPVLGGGLQPALGGAGANPPVVLPPLQPIPDGGFLAGQQAKTPGDLELFFHDLTVEPGMTYRYKVRYSLKNPVYDKPSAVKNPADANKFAIDSPDSEWSQPVAVPARTRFWCSNRQPNGNQRGSGQVDFTVFVWHDGQWNKKDYKSVSIGDEIGDGDFVTHVTLLGAVSRTGSSSDSPRQVLIVPDTGGPAELRNERTDATSTDFQTFLTNFQQSHGDPSGTPAAAPGGAPTAPGAALPPGA